MTRTISAAALVSAAAILAACDNQSTDRSTETTTTTTTTPDTTVTTPIAPAPVQTAAVADNEFIAAAASGGRFEVESSKLALEKATARPLKEFAQTLVDDHAKANQELADIVQKSGTAMTLPTEMSAEHKAKLEELKNATGADFDAKYRAAQLEAHNEAVAAFEQAQNGAANPDIRAFASKTLPNLREHQQRIQALSNANP